MRINSINNNFYSFNSRQRVAQNCVRKNANLIHFSDLKNKESFERIQALYSDGVKPSDRTYDSFTGMRDKNYLLATLSLLMDNSKKTNSGFSIAMFDMDNFKSINELLGYETGDNFIKVISKNISNISKKNKLNAYRFGGEEFVIIFDKETPEKKKEIVDSIISSINSDKYFKSKEATYMSNAKNALSACSSSSSRINSIISLKERKGILDDLNYNFTTQEARNDSYFNQKREDTSYELQCAYLSIINDSIDLEKDENTKKWLIEVRDRLSRNPNTSRQDEEAVNEYLRTRYDKTQETYQLKKWMNDFKQNNGFSITGAVVDFSHDNIKDKTPINLIDEAGKILKSGKFQRKGMGYFCFS